MLHIDLFIFLIFLNLIIFILQHFQFIILLLINSLSKYLIITFPTLKVIDILIK